ncbi:MAG: response regulator [Chloroflexota bacterium]
MIEKVLEVLILEDDEAWQKIYTYIFSKRKVVTYITGDKEDAFQSLNDHNFDMAIIDIRLVDTDQTNFDGMDVVRHLQINSPKTTIVVKSGFLTIAIMEELLHIGVNYVLDKSESIGNLASTMNKIEAGLRSGRSIIM